jgi:P-type Ca2+ transporter type 2C
MKPSKNAIQGDETIMSSIEENRFVRLMPGRIRIEVYGHLQNTNVANTLMQSFTAASGLIKVDPCSLTGRMLLLYDERQIAASDIFRMILVIEQLESECGPDTASAFCKLRPETEEARKEAAAASEVGISAAQSDKQSIDAGEAYQSEGLGEGYQQLELAASAHSKMRITAI